MKASASASKKSRLPRGRAPATSAAKTDPGARLILFDIDGTLVLTGGAGGRAMSRAFQELFGIPDAFDGIAMAGKTDAWLLADALSTHGIAPDDPRVAQYRDVYLRHLPR